MNFFHRRWDLWGSKLIEKFTNTAWITGLVGLGIAVTAGVAPKENLPIVFKIGGAMFLASLIIPALLSFPQGIKKLSEFGRNQLSLDDLNSLDPKVMRLGILGPASVGKTTLLEYLIDQVPEVSFTQSVYGMGARIADDPYIELVVLDASGQQYVQQWNLLEKADVLVIMVDHSVSHEDKKFSLDRQKEIKDFVTQAIFYCKHNEINQKQCAIFLFNKHDLWGKELDVDGKFREYRSALLEQWRDHTISKDVKSFNFCNHRSEDIVAFKSYLRELYNRDN